jgi:putative salt-induced outer membrane protein YdiY
MSRHLTAALAAALGAVAWSAAADTVHLRNGDRITGTVVRKAGDTLTVQTEYAGELRIGWSDVAEILTDAPTTVLLEGGGELETRRLGGEDAAFPLERVAYLNPTPGQSGKGMDYSGRITLAATYTRGNSDTDRVYGEAQLRGTSKSRRFSLGANGTYASDRGTRTVANWLVEGDHDWFIRPREFVYVRGSMLHDEFRNIDLRSAAGGGYGYQLVDTEDTSLSVKGGFDYVVTDPVTGEREESPALGWGLRYSQWVWSRRTQLFHEQDGFWGLDSAHDVVVRTRTGLRVPLANGLNLTAQLNLDWESDPEPGVKETDTTWILGLGYAW